MNKEETKYTLLQLKNLFRGLSLLLIFNSSQFVHANTLPFEEQALEADRNKYSQALSAYQNKQYQQYEELTQQLQDYPLYPYLKYKTLRKDLSRENNKSINQFLTKYDNSPISGKLRIRLLKSLARHQQWKDYLLTYQHTESEKLQCIYLKALHKEGFIKPAFEQVPALWMSSKSRDKSCNYIFEKFEQAGFLSNEMIWNRIELAMSKRKVSLAKYLSKSLTNEDKKWFEVWLRSHYKPDILFTKSFKNQTHPKFHTILAHAIIQRVRSNPDKAITLFSFLKNKYGLPYNKKIEIYKKIGLKLSQKHNESASHWLNKIPDSETSNYISELKLQSAIRHEQWQSIVSQIDKMPKQMQQKIRWQFWWGYSHMQLGNNIEATEVLKRVAEKRDYYGFLAADLTNQAYNFEDSPILLDKLLIQKISALPGIQRAREFYYFKQVANARREWNNAITHFTDEYLLTAAKIAYNWGWHDRAIAAIGKTKNLNDVEIRFPLVYKEIIDDYSKQNKIDSAWTYAIIRRESIFINDAKSHKGALGLMQLLPRTARATAKAIKTRYRGTKQLIKIRPNIRLGTYYLQSLFNKHNQQTVLATAAYNAGPSNVRRWLPLDKPMEAIRWIESIPFKETREYVTNVLAYNIIYQFRLGLEKQTQLSQLMPLIPAKI